MKAIVTRTALCAHFYSFPHRILIRSPTIPLPSHGVLGFWGFGVLGFRGSGCG